jgi:hypothetical protein
MKQRIMWTILIVMVLSNSLVLAAGLWHSDTSSDLTAESGAILNMKAGSTAVFNGALQATSITVNGTPVKWATPAANITATQVSAATFVANGTPVIPYSTPAVKSTTTAVGCVFYANTITGTVTVTNHGWTTVVGAVPWLAQTATGDADQPYSIVNGITVTLGIVNSALTPVANTTPAAIKALICGY